MSALMSRLMAATLATTLVTLTQPTFCSARKSTSSPSGLDKESGVRFSAPLFLVEDSPMNTIAENTAALSDKIARVCTEHGCDPQKVHLIAVSKMQSPERITAAL